MVTNCRFISNRANNVGGGMYNDNASCAIVENCTFIGNSGGDGGGNVTIHNYSAPVYNSPDPALQPDERSTVVSTD